MTTTLITGANKGLGLEDRPPTPGGGAHRLPRQPGRRTRTRSRGAAGARAIELDVTNDASVRVAVTAIESDGGLDVLINSAATATS